MEDFDYSRNFWPRWRDYPDAFSAVLRDEKLSVSTKASVARLKEVIQNSVGVKKTINPLWHHIVTEKFDGESLEISPHYPSVFSVLKFNHRIPRFVGHVDSEQGKAKVEGVFSSTLIAKLFNLLGVLWLLFFQLIGVLIIITGVFGNEPECLVIGPIWFLLTYIIFKFYLFVLQIPKVHKSHMRKHIELLIQENEAA